jgi:YidC/Oxa1 family membrane protein insertase
MMENRRLILFVALGFAGILLYMQGVAWMDKHHPGWAGQPPATQPVAQAPEAAQPAPAETNPTSQVTTGTSGAATAPTMSAAITGGQARIVPSTQTASSAGAVSLGSAAPKDPVYTLQLNAEPKGAGVSSVVLNQFKAAGHHGDVYVFEQPPQVHSDIVPLASRSITVDKTTFDLAGVQWAVVSQSPTHVAYGADLVRDGKPVLEIRKSYTIAKADDPNSKGYEVGVEYSFSNLTDAPVTIQTDFNGPVLPPGESNRSPDRQVVGGFLEGTSIVMEAHPVEEFKSDKNNGDIDLTKDSKQRISRWAGATSNYFGAIILPEKMKVGGKEGNADYINSIVAHGFSLESEHITDHDAYLTFQTREIKLEPHQQAVLPLSVFFGPKWREVLQTPHYSSFPRDYNLLLVISGGICGICTFSWLVTGIILLLQGMYWVFRDWGLAIIGLVAIVRICLHPITRRSQISMSKMSKMGPEMKRLQEKYKDDKEALNKAMMDFHKQQGLGPYLGCLPMFLQMPIWIALYGVLQTTFELRQAPFLYGFTWIKDLSQPDYIYQFASPFHLPLLGDVHGISLVPFLLSAAMFLQQQFMPKPVAATPEQISQQKMMQWMSPIMFLLIFYTYPSGLNLYIATSTAVGIIESKIVRDHIKAREEAEKAGRVFIPTKPTRFSRLTKTDGPAEPQGNGMVGRLWGAWNRVLEKAEEARKEQERKDKKK